MKKKLAFVFFIIGLSFTGYGVFNFFEKYDEYLMNKNVDNKNKIYEGTYKFDDDFVKVLSTEKDNLLILINNESYEFKYNEDKKYFESDESKFLASFQNNSIILSKDGEEVKIYYKEKK